MVKSIKAVSLLIHVFFWSGTRYLMQVDKPAILKSQELENCNVHTFSEYLSSPQSPIQGIDRVFGHLEGLRSATFPVPFSFLFLV